MKRFLDTAVVALVLGTGACGASDEASTTQPGSETPAAAAQAPLAEQVSIDDISVYQAVKAQIVKEGAPSAKLNAPVIANRPAVIRVFVKAITTARPTVEGELVLKTPGKPDLVVRDGGKRIVNELDDDELATTLNFNVPAEAIQAGTTYSFRVASGKLDGATDVVSFPADGSAAPLGAKTSSQVLRVKFVPVTLDDAGTERAADMANVQMYKDTLYKMYPVASVEVSVREQAFKWPEAVEASGRGWDKLLTGIMQLRRADASPQNVYYVGVFNPKSSLEEFCSKGGCVLGIAPQASERDVNMRVALVLGYGNRGAGGTLAQELAHAMGRWHAPCGNPDAIDDDYPYGNASIGVEGYDILDKKWYSPGSRLKDFMSYCSPTWVSDYTYNGLFERMDLVEQQEQERAKSGGTATGTGTGTGTAGGRETQVMQTFLVDKDGKVEPGPELDAIPPPNGANSADGAKDETIAITYEGAASKTLGSAKGVIRRIAGTGGRIVVAPAAPKAALRARLTGLGVTALRSASLTGR